MLQWRINWTVPNAGPSVSVLHTSGDAPADAAAGQPHLQTFIAALAGTLMPDNVSLQLDPEVRALNDASGELTGVFPITPAAADAGASAAVWSGGSGARIDWYTGDIVAGRQVRGRTFIVPLTQSAFDTNGQVASGAVTSLQAAATALISNLAGAGEPLGVWHRPVNGVGGSFHVVTLASVPTLAATLRERKY